MALGPKADRVGKLKKITNNRSVGFGLFILSAGNKITIMAALSNLFIYHIYFPLFYFKRSFQKTSRAHPSFFEGVIYLS